jgi:hypothetical protein
MFPAAGDADWLSFRARRMLLTAESGHNRTQKAPSIMLRTRYQAAHGGYALRKSRGESRPLCACFAIRADRCMLGRALPPLGGQT